MKFENFREISLTALLFCFPHAEPSLSFSSSLSGARLNTTCETTVSIPEDSDEHQEVIEVQILPQVSYYHPLASV